MERYLYRWGDTYNILLMMNTEHTLSWWDSRYPLTFWRWDRRDYVWSESRRYYVWLYSWTEATRHNTHESLSTDTQWYFPPHYTTFITRDDSQCHRGTRTSWLYQYQYWFYPRTPPCCTMRDTSWYTISPYPLPYISYECLHARRWTLSGWLE